MKTCALCGKDVIGRFGRALYCSVRCRRRAEYLRARPMERQERCLLCGREIVGRHRDARYCSRDCSYKAWYLRQVRQKAGAPAEGACA
jgi:hypothetical protein